jgi:hypothetical protein
MVTDKELTMTASRKNVKHQHGTLNPIIQQEENIMIATVDKALATSGNAQIIGRNGELPLIQFFNRHLPYTIRAHTGHFVAPEGTLSPQLDVVLVDARYPLLAQNTDGSVLVMLHSVLSTIEAKTRATSGDVTKALDNARIIRELGLQIELDDDESGEENTFLIDTNLFCYRLRNRLDTIYRKYAELDAPENNPLDTYILRVPDADRPEGVMVGAMLYFEPPWPEDEGTKIEGVWTPGCLLQHNPLSDLYYRTMQNAYHFGLAARDFSFGDIGNHFNKYMSWSTYGGDEAKRRREQREAAEATAAKISKSSDSPIR